jgi:hypothetical protein
MTDNRYLNNDDRYLLDHYINMYNEINRNIDLLYRDLEHTRNSIDEIVENANDRWYVERQPHLNINNHNYNRMNNNIRNSMNRRMRNSNTPSLFSRLGPRTSDSANNTNPFMEYELLFPRNFSNNIINNMRNFSDNVPVVATPTQIQNATRNTVYSLIANPLNVSCPITLEPFDTNTEVTELLGCNHIFSREGLTNWLRFNVRCPVCRHDIRDYVSGQEEPGQEEEPYELEEEEQEQGQHELEDGQNNLDNLDFSRLTETLIQSLLHGGVISNSNPRETTTNLFMGPTPIYDASQNTITYTGFYTSEPRR